MRLKVLERSIGKGKPEKVIFWMHGLGGDYDLSSILEHFQILQNYPCIKFIFPRAPMRPISIFNGEQVRGWYDFRSQNLMERIDFDGIAQSGSKLEKLIQCELDLGFSEEDIILMGYSQGGVLAFEVGLFGPYTIKSVIALSTYLPWDIKSRPFKQSPHIMIAHGTRDEVVDFSLGKEAKKVLTENNYLVSFFDYDIQHEICYEEIINIQSFIINCFFDES